MLTMTDLFCGAGGSSAGAVAVPGVQLRLAANHWDLAVRTHAGMFPTADHDCADISQTDPRRYPSTDLLWASPECTNHSNAKGRRRILDGRQPDLFGEVLPDPAAERSRATMWDVPRFAEHHHYRAVIVENVVEITQWVMWPAWLHAMTLLGYRHRVVCLNSMHAPGIGVPRAPQSRDRVYVVFWRTGDPAPQVEPRPLAWCPVCGVDVAAVQAWKRPEHRIGRYRAQYTYRCPNAACRHQVVQPYALPAATAIDWTLTGQRIGDRTRPLAAATLARIQAGLRRYGSQASLIPAGGTWRDSATPVSDPLPTRTTRETDALLVPVEARQGVHARPTAGPMRTQTTRLQDALVVPYYSAEVTADPATVPLRTLTATDRFGVAFIAELRGGGSTSRPVTVPLATFSAGGTHHMLVRHHTARGDAGQMSTPLSEPMRTVLASSRQSLIGWEQQPPVVEDCTFRMLQPGEIQAAMAFTPTYQVLGNRREKVRQLGNAVTPPAAEWLIGAVTAALTGTGASGADAEASGVRS